MRKLIFLAIMTLSNLSALAYDAEIDGIYYNFSGDEAEEAEGVRYLYNIGAKKYVMRSGNGLDLTETPEPIEVEDGDNGIILGAQATHQWALVSNKHMNVAQNAIDEVTAIVSPIGEKGEDAIYNLAGQRIHTPQKGLNIIGGRKVLIK